MTEAEWLACEEPQLMLDALPEAVRERTLLLFAVACCRTSHLDDPGTAGPVLDATERYADGAAEVSEVVRAGWKYDSDHCPARRLADFFEVHRDVPRGLLRLYVKQVVLLASLSGTLLAKNLSRHHAREMLRRRHEYTLLLREIFGNPFRPLACDPAWLTSDVLALARGIYEEKAFDRIPILADALQDAGCDNEDVLLHCRDAKRAHVRGCWVLDLVLGKG